MVKHQIFNQQDNQALEIGLPILMSIKYEAVLDHFKRLMKPIW